MRTLTQQYHDHRISTINRKDVRELIKNKVAYLIKDYGQKPDTDDIIYLVDRISDLILRKYRYWTWGDIEKAINNGKVGQYSRNSINTSKVTVQKIETWLYHFSEERSRQRQHERQNKKPDPIDKSNQAGDEYGEAMLYKTRMLSQYPDLWAQYDLKRIIAHIKAGTLHELTNQINQEKENHEPKQSILSGKSNRKKSYSPARY